MKESIDWEDMITKAERSATGASLNAIRAVGGVAKVLEIQRLHSQQLSELKKTMEELASRPSVHPSSMILPTETAQGEAGISFRFLALGFAAVLTVGIALGAYFGS